ncbi:MAG: branched-chain amino acid ABC transporter permease [Burkholderiaceae bacterium]
MITHHLRAPLAVGFACACLPLATSDAATIHFATLVVIWSIFAVAFDVVFGHTGMLSFGHAALFGVGAYVLPLAAREWSLSFAPALVLSGAAAAALAALFGLLTARLSGIYFGLTTLALAQLVFVLTSTRLRWLTGGDDGLIGAPRPTMPGGGVAGPVEFYGVCVALFTATLAALAILRASPFGQVLRAIRMNEMRAAQLGFDVARAKFWSFVVSGFFCGVAGATLTSMMSFVSPQVLHWTASGDVLVMTVLGGAGTLLGPAAGVLVFEALRESLSARTVHWYGIQGVIFIACTIFLPDGIAGLWARARVGLARARGARSAPGRPRSAR